MKIFFALAAILIAAACRKSDDDIRRDDTSVAPPVSVSSDSVSASAKNCGITGIPVLTDNGIGDLREGSRVTDIRERCDVISDLEQLGSEGMKERVLIVRLGSESVRAVVNDDRIWRIEITSPRLVTGDSIGVDTSLHQIAVKRGARFVPGEDGVYGFVANHCAMSFRFSVPLRAPRGGDWTAASIDSAHGDATVDRILITKCQH